MTRPDILVIVTDDQRTASLGVMSVVPAEIAGQGVQFDNAVVAVPVCGPNRASLLTGRYAKNHRVYANRQAAQGLVGEVHLGAWLRDAGYRTGMFGKWLNGYEDMPASHVAPGWDAWEAVHSAAAYYDYDLVHNNYAGGSVGTPVAHGSTPQDYVVDVVADKAQSFIRSVPTGTSLFAYVAFAAPHEPFTPAPRHVGLLSPPNWRPPSYNESDVSDKPAFVSNKPSWSPAVSAEHDADRVAELETLLSVDEGVASLLDALVHTGRLANTLIIYTSDNGFSWGEHRLWGKGVPYHPVHEVPLMLRWDGETRPGLQVTKPVSTVDIAPTVLEAAGVLPSMSVDGLSLAPFFTSSSPPSWTRARVFFEKQEARGVPAFCALRSETQLFVRYGTGEEEFYNYVKDADEMHNRVDEAAARDTVTRLRNGTKSFCEPEPPGMREW